MTRLFKYFLQGIIVVAPLGITVWICVKIFQTIDSWLGSISAMHPAADSTNWQHWLSVPGVGFAVTIVLITLVGFLASSIVTRSAVSALEGAFERVPFIRLLYTSTKDMLNAFVGEKRRFDKPVLVSISADGAIKLVGFLTAESLASLGAGDHVTVYIPQSYGFAGHIMLIPASRVQRIEAEAATVMAFIISGGVTHVDVRT